MKHFLHSRLQFGEVLKKLKMAFFFFSENYFRNVGVYGKPPMYKWQFLIIIVNAKTTRIVLSVMSNI